MAQNVPPASPAYRLHGEIDGVARAFLLTAEKTLVGAHPDADLVLACAGISRQHAALTATPEGLLVEDCGSKNGTLINGRRIVSQHMVPGDELTLGVATLRLEVADPEDAHLGLRFDDSPMPQAEALSNTLHDTDLLDPVSPSSATAQLQWVEDFVVRYRAGGGDLSGALTQLDELLGTAAIGAVSWKQDGQPAILALAGDAAALEAGLDCHSPVLRRAVRRALATGWQLEILSAPTLAAGISPLAKGDALLLLFVGPFPGRSACGPLLRLLCRLIETLEGLARPPGPATPTPSLTFPPGYVVGRSPAACALHRELALICGGDYPVLILGETGTGKEMIATTLHRSSPRAGRAFVAINCAAIPEDLLEAEMFGVRRGAATGVAPRPGCFGRAEGGTLFLDEIGELRPRLQAKLLRALEYREVQPVGGESRRVDVRVLAATNAHLQRRIDEGTFRADLYYRLAAALIAVPALRERREDLPALIQHFIRTQTRERGVRLRGMSRRALALLSAQPWPGNVRELQHTLRRIVQRALPGQVIDSSLLRSLPSLIGATTAPRSPAAPRDTASLNLRQQVAEVEGKVIAAALEQSRGNRTLAAQLLGIARNTLATKMAQHGLG